MGPGHGKAHLTGAVTPVHPYRANGADELIALARADGKGDDAAGTVALADGAQCQAAVPQAQVAVPQHIAGHLLILGIGKKSNRVRHPGRAQREARGGDRTAPRRVKQALPAQGQGKPG